MWRGVLCACVLSLLRVADCLDTDHGNTIQNVSATQGSVVVLGCFSESSVKECQWSWQDNIKDNPVPVKAFPAFGERNNDCSIRFSNLLGEQAGLWSCTIRDLNNTLTTAQFINLLVWPKVKFVNSSADVEAEIGSNSVLVCQTAEPVDECKWKLNDSDISSLETSSHFNADGDKTNCSLVLNNIIPIHEGSWTCGAKYSWENEYSWANVTTLSIKKALEFAQLSTDIQTPAGESVVLRCIVNMPVSVCQWSFKLLDNSSAAIKVNEFHPFGSEERNCSIRFKAVLEEQEGQWICGVREHSESDLVEAPPTTLTIFPAVKVRFKKEPENAIIAAGEPIYLHCETVTSVDNCQWTWRPLPNTGNDILVSEFKAFGNHSRNCSLHIQKAMLEHEGLWTCNVQTASKVEAASVPAQLSVYEPDPIIFQELTKDGFMPYGNVITLRCITKAGVDECQWSLKTNNTYSNPVVIKQFTPDGHHKNNCSLRLNLLHEHEGYWTCGARNLGQRFFTYAPAAEIRILQPETVMVALWRGPAQNITLACRLQEPNPTATCQWHNPSKLLLTGHNSTKRYIIEENRVTGLCSLNFSPQPDDLGEWRCSYSLKIPDGNWEVATATLVLLDTSPDPDEKMVILVGILAAITLLLTLVLIGIWINRCTTRSSGLNDVLSNSNFQPQSNKKQPVRYTETPTKINFQFPEIANTNTATIECSGSHHIYEQVDKYSRPTTSKSIYENLE